MKTLVRFSRSNLLTKTSLLAAAMLAAVSARADAPDAATIVTTATTAFTSVAGLVVTIAGFYIVLRIVKGIRK